MPESLLGWIVDRITDNIVKHIDRRLDMTDQKITDAQQRVLDKIANERAEVVAAVQAGTQTLRDTITQLRSDLANGTTSVDEAVAALDGLLPQIDQLSDAAGQAATEGGSV